jgi:hypothetical protein
MLQEFALTPGLFDPCVVQSDAHVETGLKQILFQLCESGMIADLSYDDWLTHVRRNVERIESQALRKDLMLLLSRMQDRRRLVPYPEPRVDTGAADEDWVKAALLAADRLNVVVTDKATKEGAYLDDQRVVSIEETIGSPWMVDQFSIDVRKDVAGMTRALEPVLRHAIRVSLSDPYMSCHSDASLTTLRIVIDILRHRKRGMGNTFLDIHCGDPAKDRWAQENPDARIRAWRDTIGELEERPSAVRVWLWANGRETFHDRHIFTDQCAVSVPAGLDCYESHRANTTQYSRLMYDQLASICRRFRPNTSPYRLLGTAAM